MDSALERDRALVNIVTWYIRLDGARRRGLRSLQPKSSAVQGSCCNCR